MAVALLACAVGVFVRVGHAHYPLHHWLFWRFLGYWTISVVWAASCLSAGFWLLARLRVHLPKPELCLVSFATGVLVFYGVLFVAGLLGALRPWLSLASPCAMLALGARAALGRARQWRRAGLGTMALTRWGLVATAFGFTGVLMVYFTIITPQNIGFDAQWYHLPIAEHYVAAGRIVPFAEGWYIGAYPHLASIVYTWAFLLPGTQMLDRVLLAAHLEFVFFLATLAAIPVLVRRLVGRAIPASWAALFLFPGVLLYDGGLFVAADHVLAFWAIPIYLSLSRAAHHPTYRRCGVLAAMAAGAILTKYQAVYLLVPAAFVLGIGVYRALRSPVRSSPLRAPLFALLLGIVLTSPQWLANWCWYGDPFYPFLYQHLHLHPWTSDSAGKLDVFLGGPWWRPQGSLGSRFLETARALFCFSFEPHDWVTYHGAVPVFGSLFTLLSFLLPTLQRARRVAHLAGCTILGVAIWYWTSHQDRYLQCLLPWMVAATVSIAHLVWTQLPKARGPLVLLVALQIIWGGDVYFIPANDQSYEIDRPSPIKAAVDLMSSGYRGDYQARLHPFPEWEAIGTSLPAGAKVLLHERYLHLGLGAMSVSDIPGWQGGLSYGELQTPASIAGRLQDMGVTHVLWETTMSHESDSLAGDLAFFEFATQETLDQRQLGKFTLARMPTSSPSRLPLPLVARYDCPAGPGQLILRSRVDDPSSGAPLVAPLEVAAPPEDTGWAIVERSCHSDWHADGWLHAADRGPLSLWVRERIR